MPAKKFDEKKAIELLEFVHQLLSSDQNDYVSFPEHETVGVSWYHPSNFPDIFSSNGALRNKIPFSALNGYDIVDIFNSFKLALALSYRNPEFNESALTLLNDTQLEVTSNVLRAFLPDEILGWVSHFEESSNYDDYNLVHAVDLITGNSQKVITNDDVFFHKNGVIDQADFNELSMSEKRIYFLTELYHSKDAKIWYSVLNDEIEHRGSFQEFYSGLKGLNVSSDFLFMSQVKESLGLT